MEFLRIAHMPDLHFTARRLDMCRNSWELLLMKAAEFDCNLIVIGGDIVDSTNIGDKQTSTFRVIHGVYGPLFSYLDSHPDAWCVMMPGNHDVDPDFNLSVLDIIPNHPRILKISLPSVIYDVDFGFKRKIAIMAMPWNTLARDRIAQIEPDITQEELNKRSRQSLVEWMGLAANDVHINASSNIIKMFIGHFTLEGSSVGSKIVSRDKMVLSVDEINAAFDPHIIMMNHIHTPDDYYSGAMYHHSVADSGKPTGFVLIRVSSKKNIVRRFVEVETSKVKILSSDEKIDIPPEGYNRFIVYVDSNEQWKKVADRYGDAVEIRLNKDTIIVSKRLSLTSMSLEQQALSVLEDKYEISKSEKKKLSNMAAEIVAEMEQ